jgi:L-amino acid N-acyltransferase
VIVSSTKTHSEIGIRNAADADLVSMLAILNREIETSAYVWAESPKTLDDRRAWLDAHRAADLPVIVATSDANVVGWASLSTFRSASGYRFISEVSVYVAPDARGSGVASAMLEALERAARGREIRSLIAVIDCDNEPSVRLFRRLGYDEAGRLNDVGRKFDQWRSEVFLLKRLPA